MSDEMSMFKKMKERISDEVNSATNKLQNMQIIDQLASSMSQQIGTEIPNQLLPGPGTTANSSAGLRNDQFSSIGDGAEGAYHEEDEINFKISPQHQLFNEHSIKRLEQSGGEKYPSENDPFRLVQTTWDSDFREDEKSVISVHDLCSDIEDGSHQESSDTEIDLLSDKPTTSQETNTEVGSRGSSLHLSHYKTKYRIVVHAIRDLKQDLDQERSRAKAEKNELANQIIALKTELEDLRQNASQHDSLLSMSTTMSDTEKSRVGSPQPVTKSHSKLKDLERLLAKCKESLKLKNSQIQILKYSLNEVEKFKDSNSELRRELAELRESHKSWTVSIAESKRVTHQEIEAKNSEIVKLKSELSDLQLKLTDSHNKSRQLKSNIQELESRLVHTSAAHQKERESLTKELTMVKNNAIKQLQREHNHNLERVRLDLEKSIESLKLEILTKDEHIIKCTEQLQQFQLKNSTLASELEASLNKIKAKDTLLKESKDILNLEIKRRSELEAELQELMKSAGSSCSIDGLNLQIDSLRAQLSSMELNEARLKKDIEAKKSECASCTNLRKETASYTEKFEQELHELNVRLDLMTTANFDQETEITSLRSERDTLVESLNSMKSEFDDLVKKNESLSQVIVENETDFQNQQDQLDHLTSVARELDCLKKENSSLSSCLNQLKVEFSDRNSDLLQLTGGAEELNNELSKLKNELKDASRTSNELRSEKSLLVSQSENFHKQKSEFDEQLVVRILSAIKNLETPNTSPGSDKSVAMDGQVTRTTTDNKLPNPISLIEKLSSLALDKSSAFMTTTQRLQAVLLDNSILSEEVSRLRDELNNFSKEKMFESHCSLMETEKLLKENQALIHDLQFYDGRVKSLEEQLGGFNQKFGEKSGGESGESVSNDNRDQDKIFEENSKEITRLENVLKEKNALERKHLDQIEDSRLLLETSQLKIEELESKLNLIKSQCRPDGEQSSAMNIELASPENVCTIRQTHQSDINGLASELEVQSSTTKEIEKSHSDRAQLMQRIQDLEAELQSRQLTEITGDHTYQIKALQKVLRQYQDENKMLRGNHKDLVQKLEKDKDASNVPDSTEFEYLKNIVYQFMLGKEPLVLARVISAVFKFDQVQVDQICKIQEAVQTALKQSI